MACGDSHLSVDSSTDLCTADVLCDERPSAEAIASPKEVKGMNNSKIKTNWCRKLHVTQH